LIHKYVSNYGTDWLKVLIVLFAFGLIASLIYSWLPFCPDECIIKEMDLCKKPYFIVFKDHEQWILFLEFIYCITIYLYYDDITINRDKYGFEGLLFVTIIFYLFLVFSNMDISNKVIALINPLNIFNQDMVYIDKDKIYKNINYFENIAWYGVLIKVITVSLIYQFIISFRNSTRRK